VPPWTNSDGLLLETRRYRQCNLNDFESVKSAFEAAKPIGSDYVDGVHHSYNPFAPRPAPFLSRYQGTLRVSTAGEYGFFVSSQDCGFLLIDGKVIASAPGRHGPTRRARPGTRHKTRLSAGAHSFAFYHAASGPVAMMVAAWEVKPAGPKPRPVAIPPEAFHAGAIGRVETGPVETRRERLVPDFLVEIAGDVLLPDDPQHLIGVQFQNISPPALATKSKMTWDFGDGQTSDQTHPRHVYLRPGLYTVKLTIKRGVKPFAMSNRVQIDQPVVTARDKPPKLDDYLPILETYDPAKLDAASLRQLVLAYARKAELVISPEPEEEKKEEKKKEEPAKPKRPGPPPRGRRARPRPAAPHAPPESKQPERPSSDSIQARREEALKYVRLAVEAGKVAFLDKSAAEGDEELHALARQIGPMARDRLGDSLTAGRIWLGASKRIARPELKAECEMEAADVALNDLLNPQGAKPLLEAATTHLGQGPTGPVASRLKSIWGDYDAATGDGQAARRAYRQAEAILGSSRNQAERTAWRGAHSRSSEQFITSGEYDRAAHELRAWQAEFPTEKIDGYLSLLLAKYWAGREKYAQAVAMADRMLTVNPTSPYIDRLLLLAAECDLQRDQVDGALATLHSILTDYPGSPLVPAVKKKIAQLEAEQKKQKK